MFDSATPSPVTASGPVDLPKPLDRTQVEDYVNDGFIAAPGLVPAREVDELRQELVNIARGDYPHESLNALPKGTSAEEVLRRILCIHQPHHISPVMERYARHPAICGALSQIVAAHLPHWDGSVKCMQTMAFVKPPDFQGQAWHQDEIYIPTRDRSLTGAWIALDDATEENGCLWVIPGSHQSGYLYPQREHQRREEWDVSPESFGFDQTRARPVLARAGDVVFFNGYLLHASFRNRTQGYRRVLVSHYMNSYSLLPWRYPKGGPPTSQDDIRRVMLVAGNDPYAWKGYERGTDVYLRRCAAVDEAESRDTASAVVLS